MFGIPDTILRRVYNSAEKIIISIDEISTSGITLTIKDTNEYKRDYEYSNDYNIEKRDNDTYKTITKNVGGIPKVDSIKIDSNTIKNTYNWENIYGKLESGEYEFKTSTIDSCIDLFIKFTIDENGKITNKEPICTLFEM